MANTVVRETSLPGLPVHRGKVRDVYDLGDRLLLVSTDRISAFDWVLPTGIPDKGRVLTQIAAFWFNLLGEPNHLITTDVAEMGFRPTWIELCWRGVRRSAERPKLCRSSASSAAIWPDRVGRNTSRTAWSAGSSCPRG